MWPDNRLINLFDIELPIIQAPMAGSAFWDLAVAVSEAGGLGSLACALLSVEQGENNWRRCLDAYYIQLGVDDNTLVPTSTRAAFDDKMCDLLMELHPEVVSFHFGLPDKNLLQRVRRAGAKIISSATTVDEARWLEDQGCDAIVAQGYEAGGHRGMFLTQDVSTQVGTMALVPQVVDS